MVNSTADFHVKNETLAEQLAAVRALVSEVADPEIPVVTLHDLGILRDVSWLAEEFVISLTPTYSGCPATETIRADVLSVLRSAGYPKARVQVVLEPAWTTDWITADGRTKLREYGIVPPERSSASVQQNSTSLGCAVGRPPEQNVLSFQAPASGIRCPRCQSHQTERISQFGSTPCKALYRCVSCKEPFDYFKPH